MSVLSRITSLIKSTLGVPALLPMGIKRQVARLLTFGLKGLGFDVTNVVRQAGKIFDAPLTREITKVIDAAGKRMDLQVSVGDILDDVRFPRSVMFETSWSQPRNYRYFAYVNIYDKKLKAGRSKWVSFYADENMTKDEIANWYENNMLIKFHQAQYSLEGYNVFEVWHNEGRPY